MDFLIANLVPDDTVYDVASELIHLQCTLRTEHLPLVRIVFDVIFQRLLYVASLTLIHHDLHHEKLIIVMEVVVALVEEAGRLVVA